MERIQIGEWKFEWLTTWEEVWTPSFVSEWKAWMNQSSDPHVFFEPSLVRAWFDTYVQLRNISPRFLIATHTSGTVIFFPLVSDRCGWKDAWLRILRPVGFTEFDYHDPIVIGDFSGDHFKSFWDDLKIELSKNNIGVDILSIPRIREQNVDGHDGFHEINRAPFLDLSNFESFDHLISTLHRQLRQELRRQPRRLSALGESEFYLLDRYEIDMAMEMLPHFLEAHRLRWPQAYKPRNFYKNLIQNCLPEGILHISVLKSCGVPISWHIGFTCKKRFYYYVPAFDHRMAQYSPGKVHLAKLIEEAKKMNIEVFDFLTGEEPYKLEWTRESIGLFEQIWQMAGLSAGIRSTCQKIIRNSVRFFSKSL
jgi:hypothetical protein